MGLPLPFSLMLDGFTLPLKLPRLYDMEGRSHTPVLNPNPSPAANRLAHWLHSDRKE